MEPRYSFRVIRRVTPEVSIVEAFHYGESVGTFVSTVQRVPPNSAYNPGINGQYLRHERKENRHDA